MPAVSQNRTLAFLLEGAPPGTRRRWWRGGRSPRNRYQRSMREVFPTSELPTITHLMTFCSATSFIPLCGGAEKKGSPTALESNQKKLPGEKKTKKIVCHVDRFRDRWLSYLRGCTPPSCTGRKVFLAMGLGGLRRSRLLAHRRLPQRRRPFFRRCVNIEHARQRIEAARLVCAVLHAFLATIFLDDPGLPSCPARRGLPCPPLRAPLCWRPFLAAALRWTTKTSRPSR